MRGIWRWMIKRCEDPSQPGFRLYGARGIRVCERWKTFANFVADMGPRPSDEHQIDRIDNDKGYEPENCRWATVAEQHRNRRDNVMVDFNGERFTVSELARQHGIKPSVAFTRLRLGWDTLDAVTRPMRPKNRNGDGRRPRRKKTTSAEAKVA
jgi:hypothetical protein